MFLLIKKIRIFVLAIAIILAVAWVLSPCSSSAAPAIRFEKMPSILAKVNGTIITKYDFDQYAILLGQTEGLKFNSLESQKKLLQDMIDVVLIEEFCKSQKLEIDYNAVSSAFETLAAQNNATPEEFEQILNSGNIDKDAFMRRLKQQLVVSSFRNAFILPKIEVSKAEVKSNRSRIINEFTKHNRVISSVSLHEIVVYKEVVGAERFEELKKDLPSLITEESFSRIASKYSNNPSAENGGKVGAIGYRDLSPLYQSMVQSALSVEKKIEVYLSDSAILSIKLDDIKYTSNIDVSKISDTQIEEKLKMEKSEAEMEKLVSKMRERGFIETFL